jgi:hypothetical protein
MRGLGLLFEADNRHLGERWVAGAGKLLVVLARGLVGELARRNAFEALLHVLTVRPSLF